MKCKCKQKEDYWNAIGNDSTGYFKRKDLMNFLMIGAIPIIGQIVFIISVVDTFIKSRTIKVKRKWLGNDAKGRKNDG